MRRIAAVAVSAATLIGGLALATPADAATGHWTSPSLRGVKAWGTFSRSGHNSVYIYGHLQDTRNDGKKACVETRVYNNAGQWVSYRQWRTSTHAGTSTLRTYHVYGGGVFHFKVATCRFTGAKPYHNKNAVWTGFKQIF